MRSSRWLFAFASLSLPLSISLAIVACGGSAATSSPATQDAALESSVPADGATTDSASPDADDAGGTAVVIPDDATLTFRSKGGFAANGMDTSVCTLVDEAYRFVVATGAFTWKTCAIDDGGAKNDYTSGSRTLTMADSAPLRAALAAVRVVPASTGACGADKPAETLEIASATALTTEVLHDTFDRCMDSSIEHASGLDDVYSELVKLAH